MILLAVSCSGSGADSGDDASARSLAAFFHSEGSTWNRVRVVDLLDRLVIARERWTGYDRDLFVHWTDEDADGCDTRREVLLRDAHSGLHLGSGPGCRIVSGVWYSAYDDAWVEGSPAGLHVDHVVPLQEAWDSGAHAWGPGRRRAFANDLDGLAAVTAAVNEAKGAHDPAQWMPPNPDHRCAYAASWIAVKARWELTVDGREAGFLHDLLGGECRGLTIWMGERALSVPARE
ncbi:MAG: HNH endonuclease family protein [bacterium]|nr:HNH endonuclease family protein [bacterium]